MKLAALALLFFASCSVSAAPPGDPRVRYTVGFAPGSDEAALQKVVEVYKQRLAGDAILHTNAESSTIVVECAVSEAFHEAKPARDLKQELRAGEVRSSFTTDPLRPRGELAQADEEWLRLCEADCERGLFGSTIAAHAGGAKVHVFEDDQLRTQLGLFGELEFLEKVTDEFLAGQHTTLALERVRFESWRKEHPAARLKNFDSLARENGGPVTGTLWRRHESTGEHVLLLRSADPRFRFGNGDIGSTGHSQDQMGYPAVSFELIKERAKDFSDWTQSILNHGMAIVLDDEILTLATVKSRLPGSGIIEGGAEGISKEEVKQLLALMQPSKLPPLPLAPLTLELEFLR